jgi:SAM-dependent methyltransferase
VAFMRRLKHARLLFYRTPVIGTLRFCLLRRVRPVSRIFGLERGQPIDRYYIEKALRSYSDDIRGTVLEVGDAEYTLKFGGEKIERSEVLHVEAGSPGASLVGDFSNASSIPKSAFDCIILTQTLNVIFDVRNAIANVHAALKPDGVLLATFPGISQISRFDMERWGDFWRFTSLSAMRMFGEIFGEGNVTVRAYGNVLAGAGFLYGLAAGEFRKKELDYTDCDYEVLIAVRAVKSV